MAREIKWLSFWKQENVCSKIYSWAQKMIRRFEKVILRSSREQKPNLPDTCSQLPHHHDPDSLWKSAHGACFTLSFFFHRQGGCKGGVFFIVSSILAIMLISRLLKDNNTTCDVMFEQDCRGRCGTFSNVWRSWKANYVMALQSVTFWSFPHSSSTTQPTKLSEYRYVIRNLINLVVDM